MPANIRFWRKSSGSDSGINLSRFDFAADDEVFVENVNPGSSNALQLLWAPFNGMDISFVEETWEGRTGWSFTIPSTCKAGSYRIRLTVDEDSIIRQAGCVTPVFGPGGAFGGLQVPALGSRANPEASLLNQDVESDEGSVVISALDDSRYPDWKTYSGFYLTYEKLIYTVDYMRSLLLAMEGNALQLQGRNIADVDPDGYTEGRVTLYWDREANLWQPAQTDAYYLMGRRLAGTAPTDGQMIGWDSVSSIWKPMTPPSEGGGSFSGDATSLRMRSLSSAAPTDGQALVWDEALETWKPGTIEVPPPEEGEFSGDAVSIQGIDVSTTDPTDGQVLVFNSVANEYVPEDVGGVSTAGWKKAIDVNLTQEANQSFVDGANSWLGVPWVGRNIASAATSISQQNGVGLVFDPNAVNSVWWKDGYSGPLLSVKLTDIIPGFVLGQTQLRASMTWTLSGADQSYEYAGFAFEKLPYASGSLAHWGCLQGFDSSHAGGAGYDCNQRVMVGAGATQRHSNVVRNTQGIYIPGFDSAFFYKYQNAAPASDPNDTAIPWGSFSLTAIWDAAVTNFGGRFTAATDADGRTPPDLNLASDFWFTIGAQSGNTSNSFTATFTRLRIEYKL